MPEIPDGAINNADRKNDSRSASYLLGKKSGPQKGLRSAPSIGKILGVYFVKTNKIPVTKKEINLLIKGISKRYGFSFSQAEKIVRNARKTYFAKITNNIISDFSLRENPRAINVWDEVEYYSLLYNLPQNIATSLVNLALKYVLKSKR